MKNENEKMKKEMKKKKERLEHGDIKNAMDKNINNKHIFLQKKSK